MTLNYINFISAIHVLKSYAGHVYSSKVFNSKLPSTKLLAEAQYAYLKNYWLLELDYASKFSITSSSNAQRLFKLII